MTLQMGPVLSFRGYNPATKEWSLTALIVADAAPGNLTLAGTNTNVAPDILWTMNNRSAYRYTFSVPLKVKADTVTYSVLGKSFDIELPAIGQSPTMAYASCNGFSSLKLIKTVEEPNAVWKKMAKRHKKARYHLLLLGGDQVYADEMWEIDGPMKDWAAESWGDGNEAPVSNATQKWLDDFFFNLYVRRWSQPEVSEMFARIPSVAMWDDHDLTDGWGSYPKDRQLSPTYEAIWKSASKAFAVFQQHLKGNELRPGAIGTSRPGQSLPVKTGAFSYGYIVGDIAILAIDMRSQRTKETQVVGAAHWNEIYEWIDALPDGIVHLIVMSSIPVVYPAFNTVETLLGIFPGYQDLEDDLADHWNSAPHRDEQTRFVRRLLSIRKPTRPLLVSGDVHIAAMGVVESSRPQDVQKTVNQLISSGIVHPGPGAVVLFALRNLFDIDQEIERGVVARMMRFPNNTAKFIGSRNYLSLEPDIEAANEPKKNRIWANWIMEDSDTLITKVIEPNEIT